MAIHFDAHRMRAVKEAHAAWWRGDLRRPLLHLKVHDAYPSRPTSTPSLSQANCTDFSYTPEQIIDTIDANLSRAEFLGDSYPSVSFAAFGPGVLSAFCGAQIHNETGNVWFHPGEIRPIDKVHVRYDPENIWTRRIKELYRAGIERWGNSVVLGMPDMGGVLDVAATFVGTDNLLLDLYDAPEEVLRLIEEIEIAWYAAFDDLSGVLQAANMGYTDWAGLYSEEPAYVLQCDFCYMIGPEMFRTFVLPTIQRDCERLTNTMYHLDGVGELAHLNDLLSIDALRAVQWQYGTGQQPVEHWMDVYERIARGGKRMQVIDNEGTLTGIWQVLEQYERQAYFSMSVGSARREELDRLLDRFWRPVGLDGR